MNNLIDYELPTGIKTGLIADNVKTILPDSVITAPNGLMSLEYHEI